MDRHGTVPARVRVMVSTALTPGMEPRVVIVAACQSNPWVGPGHGPRHRRKPAAAGPASLGIRAARGARGLRPRRGFLKLLLGLPMNVWGKRAAGGPGPGSAGRPAGGPEDRARHGCRRTQSTGSSTDWPSLMVIMISAELDRGLRLGRHQPSHATLVTRQT